jgi:hypothetical protein
VAVLRQQRLQVHVSRLVSTATPRACRDTTNLVGPEVIEPFIRLPVCYRNQDSRQNTGLSNSRDRVLHDREQIRGAGDMHALHSTAYLLTQARVHQKRTSQKRGNSLKRDCTADHCPLLHCRKDEERTAPKIL